jgi:hypothetical protein
MPGIDTMTECLCGKPPYTDGIVCPACHAILMNEILNKSGGPSLGEIFGGLIVGGFSAEIDKIDDSEMAQ